MAGRRARPLRARLLLEPTPLHRVLFGDLREVCRTDMDCGTFRENHGALIDRSVSDADLVAMQRHLQECPACSAHDTRVRRALLLFRNMPTIEPSSDFSARLDERLRDIRTQGGFAGRAGRDTYRAPYRARYRGPGVGMFAGLAAGVIAAGYLTVAVSNWTPAAGPLAMAPVVASAPAIDPATDQATVMANAVANAVANTAATDAASDIPDAGRGFGADAMTALATPAFISPGSAGSPVWPATVLAARAPARFAPVQLKLTSLGR
jgi:hypothetical protein